MQLTSSLIIRGLTAAALTTAVLCSPAFASNSHKHAKAASATATFADLDANKDGAISKVEAERNTGLKDAFASLDADKNGKLNAEEFAKFSAASADAKPAVAEKAAAGMKKDVAKPTAAVKDAVKPAAVATKAVKS